MAYTGWVTTNHYACTYVMEFSEVRLRTTISPVQVRCQMHDNSIPLR